jgi:transketolase C-terminal domain/subunit
MRRIGFDDIYTESAPNDVLLDLYGISPGRVAARVRELRWED